jgi:hypothetical protein
MSVIAQSAPVAVKRLRSPLQVLFRKLLSLRLARNDTEDLPLHLKRDIGLLDGRSPAPRDFR